MSDLITVNGVPLEGVGFVLGSYDGLRRLPTKRLGTVEMFGRNGVIPALSTNSFEPNEHALTMWIAPEGCDPESRMAQHNSLVDTLFHLFGSLDRLLDVRLQMNGSDTRQAHCRVIEPIMMTTSEVFTAEFVVLLQVPDAFWQDVEPSTFSGTTSATSPHNLTVSTLTGATAPIEDAQILVHGPAASGVRLSSPDTGGWIVLNRALASSEVWRVDAEKWRSEIGGVGMGFDGPADSDVIAVTDWAGSGARLFTMVPTVAWPVNPTPEFVRDSAQDRLVRLTLSGGGFGTSTRVQVRARRKFL